MVGLRANKRIYVMIALIALFSGISGTQAPSLGVQRNCNATVNAFASNTQEFNVTTDGSAVDPPGINVAIDGFAFNPQNITIPRGTTVVWTNNDPVIYTLWFVIAENQTTYLLSDPIIPGASWSFKFYAPMDLQYYSFERLWIVGDVNIINYVGGGGGGKVPYLQ
jgi:plastocyanin